MPTNPNKLSKFWQELKRRRVIHIIVVYATAAYVIIELTGNVYEPLNLPEWTPTLIILILVAGFPIAIIFSWIFDVTTEGILKTKPSKEIRNDEKTVTPNSWRIATYISVVVIVGLVLFNVISNSRRSGDIRKLEKTIAVLPFDNWNSDEEYYYLGDAIADEIILQLWQIKDFDRVLSRSSTMQYKTNRPTVPEIAEKLGVNYIIEGSIQRQQDNVSIRVQVIRAKEEDHIWGDEYKGEWKEIHTFQNDIAKKVAEELKIVLTPLQLEKIEKKPTENLQAYDYFLLGKHLRSQRTPESLLKAKGFFEKAIEADPGFVRAYTELARCYGNLAFYGNFRPDEAYPPALKLAYQALELDSLFGDAYDIIGTVDLFFNYNFTDAERNFKRALELDTNNPQIYKSYSELYFFKGQFAEAIELDRRALALDPVYPLVDGLYGVHLYFAQQRDSAISHLTKIARQGGVGHLYLGIIYLHEGAYEKSIYELEKAPSDLSPFTMTQLGLAYSNSGTLDGTQRILDTLEARAKTEFIPYSMRGALMAELGREKEALDYLRRGYEEREENLLLMVHIDTISFSNLRTDPQFIEIMKNVWPEE